VVRLLEHESWEVQWAALRILTELDAGDHAPDIARLLDDPEHSVRERAIEALMKLGASEHADEIAGRLLEESQEACAALIELCGKRYIPQFATMLKHKKGYIRGHGAMALGRLGAKEYAGAIADILRDENQGFTIGGMEHLTGPLREEWGLGPRYRNFKENAIEALLLLDANEYAPDVARGLSHHDRWVRRAAMVTLAKWGRKEFAGRIAARLSVRYPNADRCSAVDALGLLRDTRYAVDIAERLYDDWPETRARAARALARMKAKEYLEEIKRVRWTVGGDERKMVDQAISDMESGRK
jgi:HEAT repeat protein